MIAAGGPSSQDMDVEFLRRDEVEAFWDDARGRAGVHQQTGYLTDAWPAEVAERRFAGELRRVDRWLARHPVRRGRCLDVGCGTGVWLEQLARRFAHADGIDLSGEMVASTRVRLAAHGVTNATVEQRSVADLAPGEYDFIFVGGLLMYVNDGELDAVVGRLVAALAPGGVMVLRESTYVGRTAYRDAPLSAGLFGRRDAARPAYRAIYRPARVYRELLARQGAKVVASRANTSYLLAEVAAGALLALDRISWGALARDRGRAERVAAWLYRLGVLWPAVLVRPAIAWAWRLGNRWFVARRDR
jgi:trans-aconitate methyltransferase